MATDRDSANFGARADLTAYSKSVSASSLLKHMVV